MHLVGHYQQNVINVSERENKKRTEYFDKLDKLSIEERIRKIEEFIYVNSNKINRLGAAHVRY